MKFTCNNLPEGLQLTESGVLSGKIDKPAILTFTVVAENAKGKASQEFTPKVGADMIGHAEVLAPEESLRRRTHLHNTLTWMQVSQSLVLRIILDS